MARTTYLVVGTLLVAAGLADCLHAKYHNVSEIKPLCSIPACMLANDRAAPRVFIHDFTDGAGHRLLGAVRAMAVAAHNDMNFGGIITTNQKCHGHDCHELFKDFFGLASPDQLFVTAAPSDSSSVAIASDGIIMQRSTFLNGHNVMFMRNSHVQSVVLSVSSALTNDDMDQETILEETGVDQALAIAEDHVVSLKLVETLRPPLQAWPLDFASGPGRLSVALHVRRGDIPQTSGRHIPDEYYFDIVRRIRQRFPDADVHAWSDTEQDPVAVIPGTKKKRVYWNSTSFDGFRREGITLHLNGEDLMHPITHFARAQVFVMGNSALSEVPALLNERCVIGQGFQLSRHVTFAQDSPKKSWAWMYDANRTLISDAALDACLGRATGSL